MQLVGLLEAAGEAVETGRLVQRPGVLGFAAPPGGRQAETLLEELGPEAGLDEIGVGLGRQLQRVAQFVEEGLELLLLTPRQPLVEPLGQGFQVAPALAAQGADHAAAPRAPLQLLVPVPRTYVHLATSPA